HYGPNVKHPRWRFLTFGSVLAIVIWLAASGAFAFYVSKFSSYNKTWGSLAAVVVMLTWLWLSAVALLLGAEVNAEAERSRELRRGEQAESELQPPAELGVDVAPTAGDLANGSDHLRVSRFLRHVATRAGGERLAHGARVVLHGEQQHLCFRVLANEARQHLETGLVGHDDVHQD